MEGFRKVVDGNGMLFANPIPEEFSMPKEMIDRAINQAVKEAAEQGIYGHANTPFILAKIKELTEGNSLPANRALIESNVALAADVASEYSKLLQTTLYLSNNHHKALYREPLSPGISKATASATEIKDEIPSRAVGKMLRGFDNSDSIAKESAITNDFFENGSKEHSVRTGTMEIHSPASADLQQVSAWFYAYLTKCIL